MAKSKLKTPPSKEEIAAQKAALKEAVSNFKNAVKDLKKYSFVIQTHDKGKGSLLVVDTEAENKAIAQVSIKTL